MSRRFPSLTTLTLAFGMGAALAGQPDAGLARLGQIQRRSSELRSHGNYLSSLRVLRQEWRDRWNADAKPDSLERSWGLQTLAKRFSR